jgi:filamentous hemagglutinin family protein
MDAKGLFKKVVNLLTLSSFLLWNFAAALPEGGSVAQGSAQISQAGAQTTINQTSQNTVINWHGFDTAATESVKFNQPNSSSIALNRINSGQPTNFNGSLSANGQVWLLNPSGVLFGSTSKIDVAGLLVTTHNITDSNFMSGNYVFTFDPNFSNSKIINNGLISVLDSGIVALVGPGVENNGIIQANLGKVYLSSGAAFVLDMYGDSLINFGSSPAVQNGYVSNTGTITATGGKVYMTANSAAGVLDNVISMSGTIQATTASTGAHGQIILNGGHAGTVKVSGKLNASSGGKIETSGYNLDLTGADINAGIGGTWLLDPPVIYTSTWNGLISTQLNSGTNVTLSTGISGLGAGDIYVDAPITWGTSAVLMLGAFRNINISAPVTASNNGGFIARADLSANGTGTVNFSGSGSVTVNGANGYAKLFYNPTGGNYATPTNYTGFLLGTAPIKAGYMMINNAAQLVAAGAVGSTSIVYSYALNNDIDMTGIPLSSSIFNSNFGNNFKGNFEGHNYADGLNKTISNVTLSTGGGGVGTLMTYIDGRIDNLNFNNISLTAGGNFGGVVWSNNGTISNVHLSGALVGTSFSGGGGITGENQGVIQNSSISGTVSSPGNLYIGGITGYLNTGASIINSYNEAAVTGAVAGGIVGLMIGVSTITNVYNVGAISGGSAIIGSANVAGSTITGAYWDTTTSGTGSAYGGGFAGSYSATALNDAAMKVAANFPTFDFINTWTTNLNATYPQLKNQNTQVITQTQFAGTLGVAAAGQTVSIYADNVLAGSAVVNGSGFFAFNFNPNTVYSANPNIIMATTSGAVKGDYVAKLYGPVGNLDITNNNVTVRSDTGVAVINSEVAAQLNVNSYVGVGNNVVLNPSVNFLTTAGVMYSPVFTTPNTPYNLNGDITENIITPSNNVTFNGTVIVTAPSNILNGGNTLFVSTLDGPADLNINSIGTVTFDMAVGGGPSFTNLTVTGNTIIQTALAPITATTLTTSTVTGTPLNITTNFVTNFNASNSTSGDINLLNSASPLTITGISQTGTGNVIVNNTGDISITGAISVGSSQVTLTSTGAITQTVGGVISGDDLIANSVNGADFSAATNALNTFAATNTTSGNINLTNSIPLQVLGISQSGGDVTILNTGSVTLPVITTLAGNLAVTATGSAITLNGNITSGLSQTYNSPVLLAANSTLISTGGNIIFISTVDNSTLTKESLTTSTTGANFTQFNGDVGNGANGSIQSLTVNGNAQGVTITSAFDINFGNYTLLSNDIVTSTGGNINYNGTVDGAFTLSDTTFGANKTTFFGNVGAGTPLVSLTINGNSIFNLGAPQTVTTTGDQIYGTNAGDILTMMNDLSMSVTGLSTGQIVYGGLGVFDSPANTFTLSAATANSANGPTGQGITGTVHVGNLTLGGAGGANLSSNYPVTESFVAGQGGQQARTNTVSPADVAGVVIYCVNGFNCGASPIPPAPTPLPPDNIPPTLVFNPPVVVSCSGAGCSNLEVAIDNLEEAGVVSCGGSGSGEYGCAYGFVEAKDTNGNSRILMPGDVVYAGDQISKNTGSCMCIKSIYSKKKTCMGPGKTKAVYDK